MYSSEIIALFVFPITTPLKSLRPFSLGNLPGAGLDGPSLGICTVCLCVCVYVQRGRRGKVSLCSYFLLSLSVFFFISNAEVNVSASDTVSSIGL